MSEGTSPPTPVKRFRIGIFGRVYLFNLLLAILAMVACILVMQYLVDTKLKSQVHSLAQWGVYEALSIEDKTSRDEMLRNLYEKGHVRMTLYDAEGHFVSSGGTSFPQPSEGELARLRRVREEGFSGEETRLSVAIYRGSSLLGYGFVGPAEPISFKLEASLACLILGVIAFIACPLAMSLIRPVRALGSVMDRFGAGDLSARVAKPGNDEIGQLARGFNHLADRIRELLQSEKMLVAAISHELRTPLQRVRLALELATDDGEGAVDNEALQHADPRQLAGITADLNELDEIISDIFVIARLDQAHTASDGLLTKQALPPDEIISECVERFEASHPKRTLKWLEGPPLPIAEIDPRFMRRALLNLLENAAKYSAASQCIEIASWATVNELFIEVRDGGPGIPAELHHRIFEPFFRLDVARSNSSGTGLGLSIVQRIAEAHGGAVNITSSTGSGSTFRITLPLPPSEEFRT